MLSLLLAGLALWLLHLAYTRVFRSWQLRAIPYIPGRFPFGSSRDYSLMLKFNGEAIDDMYRQMAPHPFFGMYNMRSPNLILRDPEIIRLVMAKEFSHFRDRQGFKMPKENILGNHLFNLEGERWRALRVKLSPTFTSGKLKGMFEHFIKCAEGLEKLLASKEGSSLDVKEPMACFTTDVICSCAFGLESHATTDRDNSLRKLASEFFKESIFINLQLALIRAFPKLINLTRPRFSSKHVDKFMLNLVRSTVETREKNCIQRNDFLDLLMQLQKQGTIKDEAGGEDSDRPSEPVEMTIELMTAQCFVFLFAGYETSSSVQSFCLYELALHPEIQDRVRKEIEEKVQKHGGLTYQAIQDMEYLDMVVSETMRKYPTLMFLSRNCTKDFTMPTGHKILKGDRLIIPVWSLHHDPNYFPDPEKFDPERFSEENKGSIVPFTYLPFGEGPRICIGMRFGLLQTKVGLITVLRRYKLEPSEATQIPLELSSSSILLTRTKGPINLKLVKI